MRLSGTTTGYDKLIKRGNIVILNLGNNVGKPRPAVIIQADILNDEMKLATTIVIPLSSEIQNMHVIRYIIEPSAKNGLQIISQAMIEKVMQIEKSKIQKVIGQITKKQLDEIESRLLAVLGIR
ncbi:MAG: growth inhibitor PemK [Burkholderiales bacterium]|jgi:mRNA interferase MazF|nr:growth inhibitor PemK [Burkholderiales bacterium]